MRVRPPIIAYIDKEGWKQHVGTVEAAEAARKQEQRNQAGTAIRAEFLADWPRRVCLVA